MKLVAGSSWEFLKYFLEAYPARTALMVLFLASAGLFEGVGVISLLPLIDLALGDGDSRDPSSVAARVESVLAQVGLEPTLSVVLGVIVIAIGLKAGFLLLAMRQVGFAVAKVAKDLRLDLVRSLLAAEWKHFGITPVGRFANAVGNEVPRATTAYREACQAIGAGLQIIVYLIAALMIAWRVSIAAAAVGALLMLALRGFVRRSRAAGQVQTRLTRSLTGGLVDALRGIKSVKAMASEDLFLPLFEHEVEGLHLAQRRQVIASETVLLLYEPLVTLMLALGLLATMRFTGLPFTYVLVLAFIFYRILREVNRLQYRFQLMAEGESAFRSLRDICDSAQAHSEKDPGGAKPGPLSEQVTFDSVSFAYDERVVLSEIDLSIPAGSLVTLTGASGVGKTTLVDLLVGLLRPSAGEIRLDGRPMKDLDVRAWRRSIGYVSQEPLLFNDTVLNNVTMGDRRISREEAEKALRSAGALDFVRERPDGLDTEVGEAASLLSGGQRQRIAIARALVRKPTLLILDEATSGLDPETEAGICNTLLGLRGQVTVVAISHQPALQRAADIVYVLAGGTIRTMNAAGVAHRS